MNLIVKTTVLGATLFVTGALTVNAVSGPIQDNQKNYSQNSILSNSILSLDKFIYDFHNESSMVAMEITSWFEDNIFFVSKLTSEGSRFIFNKFSQQVLKSDIQSEKFLLAENKLFNNFYQKSNSIMLSFFSKTEIIDEKILAYTFYNQKQISKQNDLLLISISNDIKNLKPSLKISFSNIKTSANKFLDRSDNFLASYILPDLNFTATRLSSISLGLGNLALQSNNSFLDAKLPVSFSSNASYLYEEVAMQKNDNFQGKVLGVSTEPKLIDRLVANIFGNILTENISVNY